MTLFNVIFPMAGESKRFNYKFKPFLQISDETFIELAYLHFKKHEDKINQLYFIITKEQEDYFNIRDRLTDLFKKFHLIIIPDKTSGPFETIYRAIQSSDINVTIPSIICDCDHSIDIDPMIHEIETGPDIIIPYWDITHENVNDWGIIYFDDNHQIIDYSEKIIMEEYSNYAGIIGCYYFKNLSYFNHPNHVNITDLLKKIGGEERIVPVKIKNAEFFGDQLRLEKTIHVRKKKSTIFCDMDGTLVTHEKTPDNLSLHLLDGTLEKLRTWKKEGHQIIITTARSNKTKLSLLFKEYDIPFDKLICNLPSGKRYLINDTINDLSPMSYAFNVQRNKGIDHLNLFTDSTSIIKVLKGNSFSRTILLEGNGATFIRKYVLKNKENNRHYEKLKRQYYDLQRMNAYSEGICPEVFNEINLDYIYSFDVEYLQGYHTIDSNHIYQVLNRLNNDIYCSKKVNRNEKWISDYFRKKIKIVHYQSLDPTMDYLLSVDRIIINDKMYDGIPRLFKEDTGLNMIQYCPNYLSVIHGDLTFENIMYNSEINDFKLIDLDGSDFIDAIELDMGKLLQSYLSNYECWSNPSFSEKLIVNIDTEQGTLNTHEYNNTVDDKFYQIWGAILNETDINFVRKKGVFYMCTHLLRMIPYLFKNNRDACIYCIKEVIVWLNSII
jgi:hypothetical protein